jgi:hypothetical protein
MAMLKIGDKLNVNKVTRPDPTTLVRPPEVKVADGTLPSALHEGRKNANITAVRGVIQGIHEKLNRRPFRSENEAYRPESMPARSYGL